MRPPLVRRQNRRRQVVRHSKDSLRTPPNTPLPRGTGRRRDMALRRVMGHPRVTVLLQDTGRLRDMVLPPGMAPRQDMVLLQATARRRATVPRRVIK